MSSDSDYEEYVRNHYSPTRGTFSVDYTYDELEEVVSTKPSITIVLYHCYCYKYYHPDVYKKRYLVLSNSNKPITRMVVVNFLEKIGYDPKCDHRFLETIYENKKGEFELFFGS